MKLYALNKFNNYFNRQIKKPGTLATSYTSLMTEDDYEEFTYDNFPYNDGVTTSIVVNLSKVTTPDYLLVTKQTRVGAVLVDTVWTRWFITECVYIRNGQFRLSLKRDVIADFWESLLQCPMYLDKAIIRKPNSPLLLNNEGVNVNQIKKKELKLYDQTKCPWLVMYLEKGTVGQSQSITVDLDVSEEVYEELTTPINQWEFYPYYEGEPMKVSNGSTQININYDYGFIFFVPRVKILSFPQGGEVTFNEIFAPGSSNTNLTGDITTEKRALLRTGITDSMYASVDNAANCETLATLERLLKYRGMIIKDSNGEYYKVEINEAGNSASTVAIESNNPDTVSVYTSLNALWNSVAGTSTVANNFAFEARVQYTQYSVNLIKLVDKEVSANTSSITETTLSPLYDIICMPYGEVELTDNGDTVITDEVTSLKVMNAIAYQLTSAKVIDLQLLPYCPIQELIVGEAAIYNERATNRMAFQKDGVTYAIVYLAKSDTFTFDIFESIQVRDLVTVPPHNLNELPEKIKFINDCTMLRLCSPNYNGIFEFNLAKNGQSINFFNVDCTYKPFAPYIHVNPNFKGLYGQDFDDARGLVCGGDFSLGIMNSAWNQYQIQNKNFQNIFDRQIENMEFNNSITRTEAAFQVAAGTLGGAASGATAGAVAGGGYGAIAGGIVGGAASLAGGIMDLTNLAARQKEALDYSKDMFRLNLGNVKALPNSITRTSAINANNKLVPFLEVYTCTEEEEEAYYNKIKYEGMTIGIITKLEDYVISDELSYVKGHMIRNEDIAEDTHLFEDINNELMKGVYI